VLGLGRNTEGKEKMMKINEKENGCIKEELSTGSRSGKV